MEPDIVVLAAATAVIGIAQLGIVATARSGALRDRLYATIPAVGAVVLCVIAWIELTG